MKKILFFLVAVAGILSLNSCGCVEYIDPSSPLNSLLNMTYLFFQWGGIDEIESIFHKG